MTLNTDTSSTMRVLVPLGVGTALSLLGDATLYTVLPNPEIAAQAGVTLTLVGLLLGINRIVRLIFNPIAGVLYDRLPRRGLLIGSLCFGAISTAMYAAGTGFVPLLIGRILWGAAWSGIWIGGNTVVLDISDEHNRGFLSGQYQTWFFLGVGICAFLGGIFTDALGFQGGLWLSAILSALAALMWFIFLPETRPASQPVSHQPHHPEDKPFPWQIVLSTSVPVIAVRFIHAGVMASTTILWLGGFIGGQLTLGTFLVPIATLTGLFVVLRTTSSVVGGPLVGITSDKLGNRWVVIAVIMALGAGGMWLMSGPQFSLAILGTFIASISGGGVQSLVPAIVGDRVKPAQHGRVLSSIYSFGDIGSALGPPLALWLIGKISITLLYRFCAGLFLIVLLFSLWRSSTSGSSRG
ncbi:MAG: MFS transporter [Anaerolineales bacterium]|nr:MFS transporter [Anaerolineales bacterium]